MRQMRASTRTSHALTASAVSRLQPRINHAWNPRRTVSATPFSPWRPAAALDEWVERNARPISLRQLTVFGRSLTEARLLSSANYVRTELPTRIAHRLRDMQSLPYVVITNAHMSHVYELYSRSFDLFRKVPEIKSLEDNDKFCKVIQGSLQEHLSVIPRLVMGVLECQHMIPADKMDAMINTLLRSRISRRVIAEQHLALTETFNSPWHFPDAKPQEHPDEFVGEVFLKCNVKEIVDRCAVTVQDLCRQAYGPDVQLPDIIIQGHLNATLTYIPSHLEYIIGELLRNSVQATVESRSSRSAKPAPIDVLICEAPQHVIIRVSDHGGGAPKEILPFLWSFVKGPRAKMRLQNLNQVPQLAGTMEDLKTDTAFSGSLDTSLSSLAGRPPNLRLGIGLPMSRVYAEYWAGSLELHNLEGYGVDAFLQLSKFGNKNERLTQRASMDSL